MIVQKICQKDLYFFDDDNYVIDAMKGHDNSYVHYNKNNNINKDRI